MGKLDPRVKQAVKLALEDAMYAPTKRRQDAKLQSIITTNTIRQKYEHESFSYKGEYYSFELKPPRFKTNRLLPELHASMDEYLAEAKHLEYNEKPYIIGFFTKMLNTSSSLLDYYELLPGCMHRPLSQLNLDPVFILPRELTDEQVETFKLAHQEWIFLLKKRMVLDLVTT